MWRRLAIINQFLKGWAFGLSFFAPYLQFYEHKASVMLSDIDIACLYPKHRCSTFFFYFLTNSSQGHPSIRIVVQWTSNLLIIATVHFILLLPDAMSAQKKNRIWYHFKCGSDQSFFSLAVPVLFIQTMQVCM